ncbi:argininosuccinate lyase C-terminal domain-containing protein [Trichoderma evansii]
MAHKRPSPAHTTRTSRRALSRCSTTSKLYLTASRLPNGVLSTLNVEAAKMKAALDPFMLATDVADYLVRKGIPFREAHHISGRCVVKSEETGILMNELSFEQLKALDGRFEAEIAEAVVYETSVERRSAKGGTSKSSILEQIQVIKAALTRKQM